MTHHHTPALTSAPFRRLVLALSFLTVFVLFPLSSHAQSAQSVVEKARSTMLEMYSSVDHFMVKTDAYTSYNRVVQKDGQMQMETQMAMRGDASGAPMGGSTLNSMEQMDALAVHGTYQGTKTVAGVECHVIALDDPSKVDANMSGAENVQYYIGTSDSFIHGMDMTMEDGTGMEMRMVDYRNYDGVMYPSRMEMTMIQNSEEMKQQMKELEESLKQMPESMRERMRDQIEQAQSMMSGEPVVFATEEVVVNGPLPEGVFDK
jgi:uncharacterized protein YoxC